MATIAQTAPRAAIGDERFFMTGAILMALVLVAGFALQLSMGRSSFASPWPVHLHAFVFFGWVALYVTQNALVATGNVAIHRRLGWLATIWLPAMVVVGNFLTILMVRRAGVPFFFEPIYFLFMNSLSVLTFAGLATTAIINRRRTEWHRRLMFCGMALLTGPGWGRLLPGPLLMPWVGWAIFGMILLFPIAGVIADMKRSGRVHPAWWWGIGAMVVMQLAIATVAVSGPGLSVYYAVTVGSPGAAIDPHAYPPPPPAG